MVYWSIVFLILACGAAILTMNPASGLLPWVARSSMVVLLIASLLSLAYAGRGHFLRTWRRHKPGKRHRV